MKIYLDLVMILNFLIDFSLLLTVSVLLKRNIKITKIMLGAFIGGLSILFLFFSISNTFLFFFKLIISIVMILITFNYKNLKYTIINLSYLYLVSILLGGFLYFLNLEFSYKHIGIIFFNDGLSINFIFILLFIPIILFLYIKQLNSFKSTYSNYYIIDIVIKNKIYKYTSYMDTGNTLIDLVTKKPVILIDKRKILFDIKEFRLIPYIGVNGESLIKVFKIDKLILNNKTYKNILGGIIPDISLDDVDIILNRKLMER